MAWYKERHWQILAGLVLGLVYGIIAAVSGLTTFTNQWVAPFGTIFLNLLKLIAVPLVLTSLIAGIASLSDLRKLTRMGGKTIGVYIVTTLVAVLIGLTVVNISQPGNTVPTSVQERLQKEYAGDAFERQKMAAQARQQGPLQPLIQIVPANFFSAASENRNMLQIVFVALLLGIGLARAESQYREPVESVVEGLYRVIVQLVDLVMYIAPIGVFALLAEAVTSLTGENAAAVVELIGALGFYCLAVAVGLAIQVFVTYWIFLRIFTPIGFIHFLQGIAPAQLVAFSTSSSAATLPVTMEQCERELGVSEEVSSFVLPLGATINMDGTALYQSVAAVFIAQVLGVELALTQQLAIVFTAVLASIGAAAVPSAGIIMLVIILEAIGVPAEGLALVLGVDRIVDMLRTTTNITGDAMVASLVASTEGQLRPAQS